MRVAKLECKSIAPQPSWDELAEVLNGSFVTAMPMASMHLTGPIKSRSFVKAYDDDNKCVRIAVGPILMPRRLLRVLACNATLSSDPKPLRFLLPIIDWDDSAVSYAPDSGITPSRLESIREAI